MAASGGRTEPGRSILARAGRLHGDPRRARNLWWTEQISYRIGSLVAAALIPTRVSANMVTLGSLALHAIGSAFVLAIPSQVTPVGALVVLIIWQAAYGLDCADGQLARARHQPSPFGAWLDQVCDQIGHGFVFTSLSVYLAREVRLELTQAIILTALLVGGQALNGTASGLKPLLLARRGTVRTGSGVSPASLAHVTDYGLVLALAACLLPVPVVNLAVLVAVTCLGIAGVLAQVAIEWRLTARAKD